MRIAVTGNIGCGKSTVCALLARSLPGYEFCSVDDAVRGLYGDAGYRAELVRRFGTCERKALSDLVFKTPALRQELEQLATDYVRPVLLGWLERPRVVVEFPLLFEMGGWPVKFDHVLGLHCREATQRARVLARDGITVEKFERIRAAQQSTELKSLLADDAIDTDLPLPELTSRIESLAPALRRKALQVRCERFFGSEAVATAVFSAYSTPGRHYHDLTHLQELFDALDPHLADAPHAFAIEAAVWFHDFVYQTSPRTYPENEPRSAKALYRLCRAAAAHLLQDPATCAEVMLACEFILSTKGHRVTAPAVLARPDTLAAAHLFLDADLAILAADEPRLLRYDQAIAQEWGVGNPAPLAFCKGRADALEGFLARPQLYFSPQFASLEAQARANLQRLVDHWRRQPHRPSERAA